VRYISTRGETAQIGFDDMLLSGLAPDGGLYLPASWPSVDAAAMDDMAGRPYAELAASVMAPYVTGSAAAEPLPAHIKSAYGTFEHPAVVPLRQLDAGLWLLELFHGPTLAFKDVALQLLGRLFDFELGRRGTRLTVVGATSGDTGSAAIEACRDRAAIEAFILHPEGRVSEVQRRQMTTVAAANIHNIAIEGTFDDCQALLKALFGDRDFRQTHHLGAVNSINWARVMAQIPYYFQAALALGAPQRRVTFCVPSGNFGDVFAGYAAVRMGLPVERLIVATNQNDILARFFTSGEYRKDRVRPSISPSMDIQVASNFERLLFDLVGQDPDRLRGLMATLDQSGGFAVEAGELARAGENFSAAAVDEEETRATIAAVHQESGQLIDPHTAVGVAAARRLAPAAPVVVLGTAHAAKFPDAVEAATGMRPALPPRLAGIFERPERCTPLRNDVRTLQEHIRETLEQRP
jgi:threonine synthase